VITPAAGSITFLPWARQGLAGGAARSGAAAAKEGRLELPVKLRLNAGELSMALRFHGPADVVGLDPGQILRTFPGDGSSGVPPNFFALVELDRPDLPWLFSPVGPASAERWQPWLTLVVVPKSAADWKPGGNPSKLTCPVAELPPLSEAWAWAHAQVVQGRPAPDGSLPDADALLRSGARSLSRLVAARRLAPRTAYVACLVPAFEVGRKAALAEPVTAADLAALAPSWPEPPAAPPGATVTLPVFRGWEFSTGEEDDFESLARAIAVRDPPEGFGRLTVDTRQPGWGMAAVAEGDATARLTVQGALRPLGAPDAGWPAPVAQAFAGRLRAALEAPAAHTAAGPVPLVGPPIYGQSYPRAAGLPAEGGLPTWLVELNLSPELRVAAGLGAQVVRFEQESLVAAAWDQLAAWQRENEERRRRQLAEEVGGAMAKRAQPAARTPALAGRLRPRGPAVRRRELALVAARPALAARPASIGAALAAVSLAFRPGRVFPEPEPPPEPAAPAAPPAPTELAAFSPTFDTPASELLRDYFPDHLLPGMDGLLPDSIALLESSSRFVEAFLLGLNHELGRELLWRGLPADARGTPFRVFWRRHGAGGGGADINPIAGWNPGSRMGSHVPAGGGVERPLVLLFRSEIFRRYPRASLVARKARWRAGGGRELDAEERSPLFRITRAPDLTLVGFDLTGDGARGADAPPGDAGWFFLLQEQPSEPRFGLDVTRSYGGRPGRWTDLSWGHLAASAEELERIRWLPLSSASGTSLPVDDGGPSATFGANSAHMAFICRRLPFAMAVHARAWL